MPHHHSLPTKPSHFITGKTKIMFIFFAAVLLVAIGSYLYLLNKTDHLKNLNSHFTPTPSISPNQQNAVMQHPKEFADENISFFYPDTLVINDDTDGVVTWNSMVANTIVTEKALQLARQPLPFKQPTNIYNSQYFDIDDMQQREINGITVIEYTINCGPGCTYRLDQFKVGLVNYQLSFMIAGPGLSPRAEQILATLRPLGPTPTPIQSGLQPTQVQKACTMEAKLCADGSSVGRGGPNCEFAACPGN